MKDVLVILGKHADGTYGVWSREGNFGLGSLEDELNAAANSGFDYTELLVVKHGMSRVYVYKVQDPPTKKIAVPV